MVDATAGVPAAVDIPTAIGAAVDSAPVLVLTNAATWPAATTAVNPIMAANPGLVSVVMVAGGTFMGTLVVSAGNFNLRAMVTHLEAPTARRLGSNVGFMLEALC